MFDLIIVGAGPAGLTAALYALRANKKVLVLEAKSYGGQIINASKIENYPGLPNVSGFDYATTLLNQVEELGADIRYEKVINIDKDKIVITNKTKYQAKAIIIATGVENKKLGLKNEEDFIGKGVSYCATCDGNFYKNKIVAIIGGGNTALTDALYLSNIASMVYIIHRRNTFRGDQVYINDLKNKHNVEFIFNSVVKKINGIDKLDSIEIMDDVRNNRVLKVDGLFVAIGQEPKNESFSSIISVNDNGYILSNDGVHTNVDGIYVAGDAREKELRQLVTAINDGAIAATVAINEML